jgi:hypothetical protein
MSREWRVRALVIFLWSLTCFSSKAVGDTLYFIATLDSQGHINQSWFSANNWYFPNGSGGWVPANKIPTDQDTAVLTTSPVLCEANGISVNTLIVQGVNVVGGNFSLINLYTYSVAGSAAPTFTGSTVQVQNAYELSVGPFGGYSVFAQSTLTIDVGAFVLLDAGTTLNMIGPSILYDEGQIVMNSGSGLLFGGGTNQFSILPNAMVSGSGTTSIANGAGSLLFDNNGEIRGDAGLMTIGMAGATWTNSLGVGKYSTSVSNATVEFVGSYNLQAGNTNKFFGPGLIWFFGSVANATNNGVFLVGDPDPTPGTIRWDGGAYGTGVMNIIGLPDAPSKFIWDGGSINGPLVLNIDGWSQLILTNVNTKTLSGATINNGGLARWVTDTGIFKMDNGATFNNLGTATFSVENGAQLQGGAGTNLSFFNNFGLFRKTNSVSDTQFFQDASPKPGPIFNNSGILDVVTGRLLLLGGTNSGQFNVNPGARLEYQANYAHNPGAYVTGSGTNIVDQTLFLNTSVGMSNLTIASVGIIDGPGDLTDLNLLVANGSCTLRGAGALIVNSNATFSVLSGANLGRNVTNAGLALVGSALGPGSLNANTNVFWTNLPSAVMTLFQGAVLSLNYSGNPPPIFNSAGLLQNSLPNQNASIAWAFTNSGRVSITATSLVAFTRGFTQTAGSTVVSNKATMNVTILTSAAAVSILGGTLSGNGTVNGYVVNSGTVHPGGSPGQLTFIFPFTNNASGVFAVELDGTNAVSQYSQLNHNNNHAWLGGTLDISLGGGYVPALGDSFKIYTNGTPHGAFASIQGAHVGSGVVLVPQYHSSDITLIAANDPTILSPLHTGNTSSFSFQSTSGLTNIVEFTDSLNPQNWQVLTNIAGDGSLKLVTDNAATASTRFYRIRFQ